MATKKSSNNGFKKRWEQLKTSNCTFLIDDRLLFHSKKPSDTHEKEWEPMIDVALLPLTTSYIPLNFENQEYRQMNPSGFENLQLRKKYMLELAIQRLSQNFQIVSKNGCIKVAIDTK